jgi:hypothetical protein
MKPSFGQKISSTIACASGEQSTDEEEQPRTPRRTSIDLPLSAALPGGDPEAGRSGRPASPHRTTRSRSRQTSSAMHSSGPPVAAAAPVKAGDGGDGDARSGQGALRDRMKRLLKKSGDRLGAVFSGAGSEPAAGPSATLAKPDAPRSTSLEETIRVFALDFSDPLTGPPGSVGAPLAAGLAAEDARESGLHRNGIFVQ